MSSPKKPKRSAEELLTEVMLSVFRINGRLLTKGDEMVAPLGLTSARWQMLGALAMSGDALTAPEAASQMGVTRQGAQKQLNLLREEGLVDIRPNPRHQRSPHYVLTDAGASAYSKALALNRLWTQRMAANLSKPEIATTLEVLDALYESLDGQVPGLKDST